jgi:hypothetical protein
MVGSSLENSSAVRPCEEMIWLRLFMSGKLSDQGDYGLGFLVGMNWRRRGIDGKEWRR